MKKDKLFATKKEEDEFYLKCQRYLYDIPSGKATFLPYKVQRKDVERKIREALKTLKRAPDKEYYFTLKNIAKELNKCCPKINRKRKKKEESLPEKIRKIREAVSESRKDPCSTDIIIKDYLFDVSEEEKLKNKKRKER